MATLWIWQPGTDEEFMPAATLHCSEQQSPSRAARWSPPGQPAEISGVKPGIGDAILPAWPRDTMLESRCRGAWLLNTGASVALTMDESKQRALWRRCGLPVRDRLESERTYLVRAVCLAPVSLRRSDNDGGELLSPPQWPAGEHSWPADALLRRVAYTAVRALYALRLDAGEAEVALGGDGRVALRRARPLGAAELPQAVLEPLAEWYAASGGDPGRQSILLGADPEFALLRPDGRLASAARFFGAGAAGATGADALLVSRRLLYPVAELRPAPAADPAALAANVLRLLLRAAAKVNDPSLRWVAGAMPVPGLALGGHIHISGAPLTGRLLRCLDSCVAYPLALVEDPAGRGRRPRYGGLGDFRYQPHGGFEYRTLPSWLIAPAAAKAAFALALLCAREAHRLPRIPADDGRYAAAYYAGDRSELAGCLDDIASTISATESYSALSVYIEPLLDAARQGKTWDEKLDFRHKWRIPLQAAPTDGMPTWSKGMLRTKE